MQQIAVFVSGTGSNARVLIDYLARSPVGRVRLLISNRADAPALRMAAERGVETLVLDRHEFYETE
ncbi:MAG: phosphoribosylglycinamide formyltransferase, partial [Saprospiraceae bacterium]